MKVAILSFYMMESTIPLVKYLHQAGCEIDLFLLLTKSNPEGFVLRADKKMKPGLHTVDENIDGGRILNQYLPSEVQKKLFLFARIGRKFKLVNYFLLVYLLWFLVKNKYDVIHLIGQNSLFFSLHKLLDIFSKSARVHTLHETMPHNKAEIADMDLNFLDYLVSKPFSLIMHSQSTLKALRDNYKTTVASCNLIRFSLFESFLAYAGGPSETDNNLILYFGIIRPYKGVHVLLEAFELLSQKHKNFRLIVAGRGKLYFDRNDYYFDNVTLINKELTEIEMVDLIRKAKIIVCPYLSASQSGIPMLTYLFNKPIVASNIGGLSEVIANEMTGLLVEPGNTEELAKAMERLICDKELYDKCCSEIQRTYAEGEFSWPVIAEKTKNVYHLAIKNQR